MKPARICVPVCVQRAAELRREVARAAELAGIVELRFDCFDAAEIEGAFVELEKLLRAGETTLIITFRPAQQGGRRTFDEAERARFWSRTSALLNTLDASVRKKHFVDLELDAPLSAETIDELSRAAYVIRSQHDFGGVPDRLEDLYESLAATRAEVLKIAVAAHDATDCLPVFDLLARARRDGRELIALAMGAAGISTRVLGPSRGAFLTFAASDTGRETAPGQLNAQELRDLYRIHAIDDDTIITGLVGSPVSHSLSPHMHNAAFAARGLNAVYLPFEVSRLDDFLRLMVAPRTREMDWRLRGLSVTAPHKSRINDHLDWIEPKALDIGAVNTVVVAGDELRGYNTDADATLSVLRGQVNLRNARVAVIGAGGAARALLWALRESGASVTVHARDVERARETATRFDASLTHLDGARFDGYDAVINTTPLGTRGPNENETPAIAVQLRGARIAYDLVYNPSQTRFLREAQQAGCRTIGGLPMLIAQAAEQFKLWTGQDAPVETMREAAERKMSDARC